MRIEINWCPLEGHSINTAFSGYSAAPYFTGQPDMGWCLYVRGGGCWQQRTKPELPPKCGMLPKRIDGAWVWSEPAPAPPNLAQSMAEEIVSEILRGKGANETQMRQIIQRRIEPMANALGNACKMLEKFKEEAVFWDCTCNGSHIQEGSQCENCDARFDIESALNDLKALSKL